MVNRTGFSTLLREVVKGNLNPGIGSKNLFGSINYLRSRDGARIFFQKADGGIQIVGYANKSNEAKVVKELINIFK